MTLKSISKIVALGFVLSAVAVLSCMDREPAWTCPIPQQVIKQSIEGGGFDKVDMVVVLDNSGSMTEEQQRLGTGFTQLIDALTDPPQDWKDQGISPVNNIRIGMVSTDMGVGTTKLGGTPGTKGYCQPKLPGGDAAKFLCPNACPCTNSHLLETTPQNPNTNLTAQVTCNANNWGSSGCGFELQLYAAAYALQRSDHADFIRANSLLAVMIVSDESDCSAKPDSAFWKHSDLSLTNQDINLYCAKYEKELIPTTDLATLLLKKGIDSNEPLPGSVVFAAIVGVPMNTKCQGYGTALADCLSDPAMQFKRCMDGTTPILCYACVSQDVGTDGKPKTQAMPGRRYISLAQEFENNGFVYSICNADWGDAMKSIAKKIAENLFGATFNKQLEYDTAKKTSKCDVVFSRSNSANCPRGLVDMGIIEDKNTGKSHRDCKVNPIPTNKNCAVDITDKLDNYSKPGWIYCEASKSVQKANPKLGAYNVILNTAAKNVTGSGGTLSVECLIKADMPAGLCPTDAQQQQ